MSAAAAELFMAVCRTEVMALKPGNVPVHAAGHGMSFTPERSRGAVR